MAASAVREKDRYLGVVLGFNVKILEDAEKEAFERGIKIFNEKIIYNLVRIIRIGYLIKKNMKIPFYLMKFPRFVNFNL